MSQDLPEQYIKEKLGSVDVMLVAARRWNSQVKWDGGQAFMDQLDESSAQMLRRFAIELACAEDQWLVGGEES